MVFRRDNYEVSDPSPLAVCRLSPLALGRFVEDERAHCKEGFVINKRDDYGLEDDARFSPETFPVPTQPTTL